MAKNGSLTRISKLEARNRWIDGKHVAFSNHTNATFGMSYTVENLGGSFDYWVQETKMWGGSYFYAPSSEVSN